jgi:hypothetical protein
LVTVAIHEILHVFGLKHSAFTNAVMYSEYNGSKRKMSRDDILGIRKIYKNHIYTDRKYDKDEGFLMNLWNKIVDLIKRLF